MLRVILALLILTPAASRAVDPDAEARAAVALELAKHRPAPTPVAPEPEPVAPQPNQPIAPTPSAFRWAYLDGVGYGWVHSSVQETAFAPRSLPPVASHNLPPYNAPVSQQCYTNPATGVTYCPSNTRAARGR